MLPEEEKKLNVDKIENSKIKKIEVKRTNMFSSMTKIASLAQTVSRQWGFNSPTFSCYDFTHANFELLTNQFVQLMSEDASCKTQTKIITRAIKQNRIQIKQGIEMFKNYITGELFRGVLINKNELFESLELVEKFTIKGSMYYIIPTNAAAQVAMISNIIIYIQQDSNAHLLQFFGLSFWTNLYNDYKNNLIAYETIRTKKSVLSRQKKIMSQELKTKLHSLQLAIKAAFYNNQPAQKLRNFGFLKENF